MNPLFSPLLAVSDEYRWFLDLEFWAVITFIGLMTILVRYAFGPIISALQNRQKNIEDQLREIEEAQREIRILREEHEERKRQLRAQAQEFVAEAKRDAVSLREEMVARARTDIERIAIRADREIDLAHRKAMHDLADAATEQAMKFAVHALSSEMTDTDHDRLVGRAIQSMAQPVGSGA